MKRKLSSIIGLLVLITINLYGQDYNWKQETTNFVKVDSITYYFPSNVSLDDRIKEIEGCEKAIEEVLKLINENDYTKTIDVFFVNSRKELLRYTGQKGRGVAYYYRNAVFSLTNQKNSVMKHEMAHMITADKWGVPANSSVWIYEGIATYLGGYCSDYSLEEVYQYFIQSEKVISLDSLAFKFRDYYDIITYTESAFLAKYLIDNFGIVKLKKLWVEGIEKFENIYGFSVTEFEERLKKEFKKKYPNPIEFDWEEFDKGCG